MSKDNSGPAFPSKIRNEGSEEVIGFGHEQIKPGITSNYPGMTLRDYFAAKALQGMISTAGAPCLFGLEGGEHDTAKAAYKIADAMLAARSA